MRKAFAVVSGIALGAAVALAASAQTREAFAINEPGMVGAAHTTTITATIKAIDRASRAITFVEKDGKEATFRASKEVRNFDQLKVGDRVAVQYAEALVVELKKGGGSPVARTEQAASARAAPGAAPGAMVGRQVTIVGDVIDLDPATRRVTLKGPQRTIDVTIRDPEQFKLIAKGDQLQATYLEGVAVDVAPAAPK